MEPTQDFEGGRPPTLLRTGLVLEGRWRLGEKLGQGGFATVYAATHTKLESLAAVKVLEVQGMPEEMEVIQERFLREAKLVAGFKHPNVVQILDYGFVESTSSPKPFMVLEYLDGHDLEHELLTNGPLTPVRARRLFLGALDALRMSHERGVVHRDLKPSNLYLVDPGQPNERLVVLDFGIARVFDDPSSKLTATNHFTGTPAYLAPEYIEAQLTSPAVDVYQMGLIIAESLTGAPVVQASAPLGYLMAHCNGGQRMDEALLETELGAVLARAVSVDPADRHENAGALGDALRDIDWADAPDYHAMGVDISVGGAPTPRLTDVSSSGIWARQTAPTAPAPPALPVIEEPPPQEPPSKTPVIVLGVLAAFLLGGLIVGGVALSLMPEREPETPVASKSAQETSEKTQPEKAPDEVAAKTPKAATPTPPSTPELEAPATPTPEAKTPEVKSPEVKTPELATKTPEPKVAEPKKVAAVKKPPKAAKPPKKKVVIKEPIELLIAERIDAKLAKYHDAYPGAVMDPELGFRAIDRSIEQHGWEDHGRIASSYTDIARRYRRSASLLKSASGMTPKNAALDGAARKLASSLSVLHGISRDGYAFRMDQTLGSPEKLRAIVDRHRKVIKTYRTHRAAFLKALYTAERDLIAQRYKKTNARTGPALHHFHGIMLGATEAMLEGVTTQNVKAMRKQIGPMRRHAEAYLDLGVRKEYLGEGATASMANMMRFMTRFPKALSQKCSEIDRYNNKSKLERGARARATQNQGWHYLHMAHNSYIRKYFKR